MKHKINQKKLNRTSTHRKAMLINMSHALVLHEQIYTTDAKAKNLRPYIERLVTIAKNSLDKSQEEKQRKKIILLSKLGNSTASVNKILNILAERYKTRPGGYTRIVKAGFRQGDSAPMSYIQFVDKDIELNK